MPDAIHPNEEGAHILAQTAYSAITGDYGGLKLPILYTDYMVLQRNTPLRIHGTANTKTPVTVSIDGQKKKTIADKNGKWEVILDPIKAGDNYELSIQTPQQSHTFHHVAAGEVWLCSGQSNMQFMLQQTQDGSTAVSQAHNSQIRLFHMKGSFLAVIVFVALYFVKAGYGMFRTRSWGWSVPNKVGWVLMEAPSFVVMGLWAWKAGVEAYTPQAVFVGLFMLHYFQRSFVFPLLMKGKSRMPLAIMAMGILFNVINATLLAASFFNCALPGKYEPTAFWTNPLPWVGVVIFFIGRAINLHADHVIRNLRKPGDTRHYLPEKGFYRYVTSANYFGELVEWTGFALLTAAPAA